MRHAKVMSSGSGMLRHLRLNGHLKGNSLNLSVSKGTFTWNKSVWQCCWHVFLEHKPLYPLSRLILPKHWKNPFSSFQLFQSLTMENKDKCVVAHHVPPGLGCNKLTYLRKSCEYLWAPVWAPDLNDLRHTSFHTFLPFFYLNIMAQ